MKPDKSKPQDSGIVSTPNEPTLNQDAVNEVVDEYEISANSDQPTEVDPATQKELGEVERALEDSVMGIEDAS